MTTENPVLQRKTLDVVTVGESMVLVAPTDSRSVETSEAFTLDVGRAESNVAVHVHQLGHRVLWLSAVGHHALGRRLFQTRRRVGLDVSHVTVPPDAPTGLYVKDPGQRTYYYRSESAASHLGPESVPEEALLRASIVHLTGIISALSESCRTLPFSVARRAQQAGAILSVDVNYRPALWTVDVASEYLLELCRLADIVFVGLGEAHTVWGCTTPAHVRALFPDVDRVVVKNADMGAVEFDGDKEIFVASLQVNVVEPVGAGDAFAAGYLSGIIQGLPSESRLRLGHQGATHTLFSVTDLPAASIEGVS